MESVLTCWQDGMKMMKSKFDKVVAFRDQRYDKIKKGLNEKKSFFTDAFFPPSRLSLGHHAVHNGESVEWKRPTELSNNPKLFENKEGVTVVCNGKCSSNWTVSALSILACLKEFCYKVVLQYWEQEWKDDAIDDYAGIFCFRFWRFGQWVDVVVDDLLPVVDGQLIFTHSQSKDEFWVSLVEKAYAKLLGSYEALEENHLADVLVDMTGGISETIDLRAGEYDSNDDLRAELFQMMSSEMADHSIMCASIATHSQDEIGQRTEMGLIRGHAYHITAVKRIHLGDSRLRNLMKGREKVSMIRLRDPYGFSRSEQTTPNKSVNSNVESDGEYAYSTSQLTRLLSKNPAWAKMKESEKGRIGLGTEQEGEFWMPVDDFVSNLGELTIVRLYNNNIFARGSRWKESAMKGCWTVGQTGSLGCRSGGGNTSSETFLGNPQFLFEVKHPEQEVVIQMLQWDGREASPPSNAPTLCHQRTLLIGFNVIKVENNRKYRLHKLWSFYHIAVTVGHQRRRELCYRGCFPKGKYLLVPTTYKPGCEGYFLIRLISQVEIKLRRLERDMPKSVCSLPCVFSNKAIWVSVISVKNIVGIAGVRNIYWCLKCENQKVKSEIVKADKEVEWNEQFIFYRKCPDRPIIIKVYSYNVCVKDKLIGWIEIPAAINHAYTHLEVCLIGKDGIQLENTVLRLRVLTEDNLMAI